MYGNEINDYLEDIPCYKGTWARDTLPQKLAPKPACIISNTDKKGEEGAHWVAIHLRDNGTGFYFDSLGNAPLYDEFVTYMNNRCPLGWRYNTCVLQGRLSSTCGLYCIHFVQYASKQIDYHQFAHIFSPSRKLNDKRIAEYYDRPDLETTSSLE